MKQRIMLMLVVLFISVNLFGQTKRYYRSHSGQLAYLTFSKDKENDYVAETFNGINVLWFKYIGESQNGNYIFERYTYQPETKIEKSIYGGLPMVTYTGRTVKHMEGNRIYVSNDYSKIINNGETFTSISKATYDKLNGGSGNKSVQQPFNNGSTSKGKIHNEPYDKPTNKHGYTPCKGCDGTGRCHYCNGYGYIRSYDDSKTQCAICNGRGKCGVCYGTGRIRY